MKETVYYIYKATNKSTGKSYIGFTNNIERRKRRHKYDAFSNFGNTYFQRALRKYGWDSFEWELLFGSKDKKYLLKEAEPLFIKIFNTKESGYNLTEGGDGIVGYKHTIKSIEKIRKANTKSHRTPEFRKAASIRNKISHSTKSFKQKMSQISSNISEETRKLRANAAKRQWSNPNKIPKTRKSYLIRFPNGSEKMISGLRKFCRTFEVPYPGILQNHQSKGYSIVSKY